MSDEEILQRCTALAEKLGVKPIDLFGMSSATTAMMVLAFLPVLEKMAEEIEELFLRESK